MDLQRFDRATALSKSGLIEEALGEFQALESQAIDQDEKGLTILYQASCLEQLGRIEEARLLWSRATSIRVSPSSEILDASLTLAEGRQEEGLNKLRKFLDTNKDLRSEGLWNAYTTAQDELGRLLYDLGRYQEAIEPLEGALSKAEPGDGRQVQYYLGVCYFMSGDFVRAEERLLQCVRDSQPDSWWTQAQYYLGCTYFEIGDILKARQAFEACRFFLDTPDEKFVHHVDEWLARVTLAVDRDARSESRAKGNEEGRQN